MDTLAQQYSQGGAEKIFMIKQEDGAGPYQNKVHNQSISEEFK